MAYTILDILDKLIQIEQHGVNLYRNMAFLSKDNPRLQTVLGVLAKEEERHVVYYSGLKKELSDQEIGKMELNFEIYDKVSTILMDFKKSLTNPEVSQIGHALAFALDFERKNAALLISILDNLGKAPDGYNPMLDAVFSTLISEEEKHVSNLENFIKS